MSGAGIRVNTYTHEQIVDKLTDFLFMQEIREQGEEDILHGIQWPTTTRGTLHSPETLLLPLSQINQSCICHSVQTRYSDMSPDEKKEVTVTTERYKFSQSRHTPYLRLNSIGIEKTNVLTTKRSFQMPAYGRLYSVRLNISHPPPGVFDGSPSYLDESRCACTPTTKDTQSRTTITSVKYYITNKQTGEDCSLKVRTNSNKTISEVENTCNTLSNDMIVEGLYDYLGAE
jgi:hypothetical protein